MKFLAIFALAVALATAVAGEFPEGELKSRNIVIPAGRPEGRISRGQTAKVGQFPYQVGLMLQAKNGNSWCGGSLISNTKVLTAAHCTEGIDKAYVRLGGNRREFPEVTHTVTRANFIIHPRWDSAKVLNDIALIDIPHTPYSKNIQAIKLPSISSNSSYSGDMAIASGWGRISDYSQSIPNALQFTELKVLPNDACSTFYGSAVTSSNICVATSSRSSTCKGDSGGPLVHKTTKTQIGLTSFGPALGCEKGFPAVFTRLSSYLGWIKDKAGVSY